MSGILQLACVPCRENSASNEEEVPVRTLEKLQLKTHTVCKSGKNNILTTIKIKW